MEITKEKYILSRIRELSLCLDMQGYTFEEKVYFLFGDENDKIINEIIESSHNVEYVKSDKGK